MLQTLNHAAPEFRGREILDIDVAWLDRMQALDSIRQALARDEQKIYAFLNAHNANIASANREYRSALQRCTVLPDGLGVDLAARALYGQPFPANLNGTDFVPALLAYLVRPLRVALIGAQPHVLSAVRDRFHQKTPWHEFVTVSDGYFDKDDCDTVLQKLAELQADIVLVAMGSPLQEVWIKDNIGREHGRIVIGVGALFDFMSEAVPRAPAYVRKLRSEWLFRLLWEPGRLWRRYLLGNPLFLLRVLGHRVARRKPAHA